MKPLSKIALTAIVALLVGALPAASAAGAETAPVVLGSVAGVPSATQCRATLRCTYVPFTGQEFLTVPFDGTITSFSVNSAAAGGPVELRVLSSASPQTHLDGTWTGAGTGPAERLKAGVNTFEVDMPVKAGDTIALDDESGASIFDDTSPFAKSQAIATFDPAIADGVTANNDEFQTAYSLLMSATVVPALPVISGASESRYSWREPSQRRVAMRHGARVGTTFMVSLNQAATLTIGFSRQLPGRMSNGSCVARGAGGARCIRSVHVGALTSEEAREGADAVPFSGRLPDGQWLAPGRYVATILATSQTGASSESTGMAFTILPG